MIKTLFLLSFLSISSLLFTNEVLESLTQDERENLPQLIALSLRETFKEQVYFDSFIEGLVAAEEDKPDERENKTEVAVFNRYTMQIAADPKIKKNLNQSLQYLNKKQKEEKLTCVLKDRTYYKTIKKGISDGINTDLKNKLEINFVIKDINDKQIAGNYSLASPMQCELSELISGMAIAMIGMKLNEIREIYIHPEFTYGVFSKFGEGKAISIKVELIKCQATDKSFKPILVPVDLSKYLKNCSQEIDLNTLEKANMFLCGKKIWSFYKKWFPEIRLEEILKHLEDANAILSLKSTNKETLQKLHWLIYRSEFETVGKRSP